jgi:hypothetical protein
VPTVGESRVHRHRARSEGVGVLRYAVSTSLDNGSPQRVVVSGIARRRGLGCNPFRLALDKGAGLHSLSPSPRPACSCRCSVALPFWDSRVLRSTLNDAEVEERRLASLEIDEVGDRVILPADHEVLVECKRCHVIFQSIELHSAHRLSALRRNQKTRTLSASSAILAASGGVVQRACATSRLSSLAPRASAHAFQT